jgi:hypothetical protein
VAVRQRYKFLNFFEARKFLLALLAEKSEKGWKGWKGVNGKKTLVDERQSMVKQPSEQE